MTDILEEQAPKAAQTHKVGKGTPSSLLKNLWHKHREENKKSRTSLKQFARSLSDALSKLWLANKSGDLDRLAKKVKQENRGGTIRAIAQATKSSRRGVKS